MRWILVDVLLVVAALGLLAVVGLAVWRRLRALGRELSRAGELVGQAVARLEQGQATDLRSAPARHR